MEKITESQARQEAKEIVKTIDLEEGETKKQWIECYIDALREDGLIKKIGGIQNVQSNN